MMKFEIHVDGCPAGPLRRGATRALLAREHVEVRDTRSGVVVANCYLEAAADLPEQGWEDAVALPDGGEVAFKVTPRWDAGRRSLDSGVGVRLRLPAPDAPGRVGRHVVTRPAREDRPESGTTAPVTVADLRQELERMRHSPSGLCRGTIYLEKSSVPSAHELELIGCQVVSKRPSGVVIECRETL